MEGKGRTRNIPKLPSTRQRPSPNVQPVAALHPSIIKQLCPFDAFPVGEEIAILHNKNAVILLKMMRPGENHANLVNSRQMCDSGLSVRRAIGRSTLLNHHSTCLSIRYYPKGS